jgi:GxxExxY protein
VYSNALAKVLKRTGHKVEREARVPVWFEREIIGFHRLDMIVDEKVVIEIKATERLPEIADRQLRSYLNATRLEVGLILHFGVEAKAHRVSPRTKRPSQESPDAHRQDPVDPQDQSIEQ